MKIFWKTYALSRGKVMIEHVSIILSTNNTMKYQDLGRPTISCIIGGHIIDLALLDLNASVNLLPYSIYLQLNLD